MPGLPQITVFALCYNEAMMLPYFVRHYRFLFPGCKIVLYDNESTDQSVKIAGQLDCEVRTFETGGKLSDETYLAIKNNCWKTAETDWVLICDVDEHCLISRPALRDEAERGSTLIKFEGWNMVNLKDDLEIANIRNGVRAPSYDKAYLFNRKAIQEINYAWGCHKAYPVGNVKHSLKTYLCKHYKYINIDYMIKRHAHYAERMSDHNKKLGLGGHYEYPPDKIRAEFEEARRKSTFVI